MTEQEKLIGKHPSSPNFFATWLIHEDKLTTPNKKHRKLDEISGTREKAIDEIAQGIITHHLDNRKIQGLKKRKVEIMKQYNLNNYAEYLEKKKLLPTALKTQKGNGTEIILSNYLQAISGLQLLAYKLTYNGNVEQSLKGDDCLLFNLLNLSEKVILGEAKFRSKPSKDAIQEIVKNLEDQKRLPISIPFIVQHLITLGNNDLAEKLENLEYEIAIGRVNVINVGLLLSTKSTSNYVEANLDSTNENLVFLSLGVDNPKEIIEKAFQKAKEELMKDLCG